MALGSIDSILTMLEPIFSLSKILPEPVFSQAELTWLCLQQIQILSSLGPNHNFQVQFHLSGGLDSYFSYKCVSYILYLNS